jgi:hypothetical protein
MNSWDTIGQMSVQWGTAAGRLAGAAALALAIAVIWFPWLAPGLHAAPPMMN